MDRRKASRAARGEAALLLGEMVDRGLIEYVPFPDALRGKYQSYTQADLGRLREVGYDAAFANVAEGVSRYCASLMKG